MCKVKKIEKINSFLSVFMALILGLISFFFVSNEISKSQVDPKWSDHGYYSDYNNMKYENFYSNKNTDLNKTTVNWKEGKITLGASPSAVNEYSYKITDESSILNNFRGPITTLSNDNLLPIIGGKICH